MKVILDKYNESTEETTRNIRTMSDKIKTLYDQLSNDGYDTGDISIFSATVKDPNKARKLYETLSADGYETGDFNKFYSTINPGAVEAFKTPSAPRVDSKSTIAPGIIPDEPVDDLPPIQSNKPGYQETFDAPSPSQMREAKAMTPEDTIEALNQTTPGLTKYSLGAEINTLGMDYEMNKAFPKEGYQDSSRGKTYEENTIWDKPLEAEVSGPPIDTTGDEYEEEPTSKLEDLSRGFKVASLSSIKEIDYAFSDALTKNIHSSFEGSAYWGLFQTNIRYGCYRWCK